MKYVIRTVFAFLATGLLSSAAWAQFDPLGGFGLSDAAAPRDPVAVTAEIRPAAGGRPAVLAITAQVAEGYHIYSLTQPKGGPLATKIKLDESADYRLLGDLTPDAPPHKSVAPEFNNLPIETHEKQVTWQVGIEPTTNQDLKALRVAGKLNAMACNDRGCLPPKDYAFSAAMKEASAGSTSAAPVSPALIASTAAVETFQQGPNQPTIRGQIEPSVVQPGGTIRLSLTVEPAAGWHVYAHGDGTPPKGSKPVIIQINGPGGWTIGTPKASEEPKLKSVAGRTEPDRVYEHAVTWTVEIKAPESVPAGEYGFDGLIGYQTCKELDLCLMPTAANFSVKATIDSHAGTGVMALAFTPAEYPKTSVSTSAIEPASSPSAAAEFDPTKLVVAADEELSRTPFALVMLFGFAGGLLLNLMPCVLPVIGLKILSFVEQSGHSRAQILKLNIWYSLGLLSVFMVLAGLAAFAGLGWGQLFSFSGFNIALAAIVFGMGLSFLGVWEIPIPGFVGSGATGNLARKEGAAGAFSKGAITTVLATPCSGPFLASALAWAVAQPAPLTFAVFGAVGVGMASPYLLIGAFPALIRFLPKPGMWMDTFKQIMGFVLLATVVYILTFIPWGLLVPTVALLIGIWAGCWWIGRTPLTSEIGDKLRAWAVAGAVVAIVWVFAFPGLNAFGVPSLQDIMTSRFKRDVEQEIASSLQNRRSPAVENHAADGLPWQPFSVSALQQLTRERKTVLVDFTADWCQTCKVLEATVLNQPETRKLVDDKQIVTLQADWTDGSPEVTQMLDALGSKQIPVIAIFPADRPNEPIVLRGFYTRQDLHDAINGIEAPQTASTTDRSAPKKIETAQARL